MNKIRRNFRQIYAEGCDVLGGGGGMMLQALPPPVPCDGSLGEECKRYLFFFQLNVRSPCQIRCSTLKQMEEKRSKAVN